MVWLERYGYNPFSLQGDSSGYGAVHPTVIYFPTAKDGYKFWMYYEKGIVGTDCDVYLARSNDGLSWTSAGVTNPLITDIDGQTHIPDPDIVYVNNKFYLFLMVGVGGASKIYRLESTDGKVFTKNPTNAIIERGASPAWDKDDVVSPCCIYENGTWYVWYVGENANVYKLGLATSTDGINYTKHASNPLLYYTNGGIWHIGISKRGSTYYLYFTGDTAQDGDIKLFTSTDKINWTQHAESPVLTKLGVGWELTRLYRTEVMRDVNGIEVELNGKVYCYYSAYGGSVYKIGLAYHTVSTPPPPVTSNVMSIGKAWGFRRWSQPQNKWL
jgi:sucrose-6-phosphate hydrolase SacC (GH32 family)